MTKRQKLAPDVGVITRTFVLAFAWINMILTAKGWNPLPFTEDEVGEAVGIVLAFAATVLAWWKNNSVTSEAQTADIYMHSLKAKHAAEDGDR